MLLWSVCVLVEVLCFGSCLGSLFQDPETAGLGNQSMGILARAPGTGCTLCHYLFEILSPLASISTIWFADNLETLLVVFPEIWLIVFTLAIPFACEFFLGTNLGSWMTPTQSCGSSTLRDQWK